MIQIAPSTNILKKTAGIIALVFLLPATLQANELSPGNTSPGEPQIRGMVRSANRIEINPQLDARISRLDLDAGQNFKTGDTLYELDCTRYLAEQAAVRATVVSADIELATKQKLLKHKAVGRNEVAMAKASLERNRSELAIRKAINENCTMRAPFDGRVTEVNASVLEFAPKDKPLMVVIDNKKLEIELIVPSRWLAWLKPGLKFQFTIDETGKEHTVKLHRIGAEVDAVSQTVKILARFDVQNGEELQRVLPGMSGTALFPNHGQKS